MNERWEIKETLDCLNGAPLFTSLDLKSGYWQVEMEEDSKTLTAFTVRPLGLYECERMPFGLTNAQFHFPMVYAELFRQSTSAVLYHIS